MIDHSVDGARLSHNSRLGSQNKDGSLSPVLLFDPSVNGAGITRRTPLLIASAALHNRNGLA
jgi:hypothetical protein